MTNGPTGLGQRCEQGVLITLAVHDVDRFNPPLELLLDGINSPQPSGRFPEALLGSPLLVTDDLLETEDGFQRQQPQRPAFAVRTHCQREVAEEPLRAGSYQVAEAPPLLLTREFELRRVVRDDDPRQLGGSPGGLAEMWREDAFRRDLLVAEESVGRLPGGAHHQRARDGRPSHRLSHTDGGADAGRDGRAGARRREGGSMSETQESISAWAEQTFGPSGSNIRVAVRAQEEPTELLRALSVDDDHPKAAEEVADVVIVLQRLASRLGVDLWQEVERKMAINRARVWNMDGTGHGYHVRDRGAP
jgi:NTP pyrophosphatase (non-canonical NTP hydrolase)